MKDAWKKNKDIFKLQLSLNKKELEGNYPPHWLSFISAYTTFNNFNILDLGCGTGAYYELCRKHFPHIKYHGADYSEHAILLAKKTWGNEDRFFIKDFWNMTKDFVENYDNIILNAVLDVMPNGDEALEFLLKLKPKSIFIQRMETTDKPSYTTKYKAYDKMNTFQYYHNAHTVSSIIKNNGYKIYSFSAKDFYLEKI